MSVREQQDAVGDGDIDFCTLGMFIIDEIHPAPNSVDQTIQRDIIGGAGTYSALGARLFSPSPKVSKSVAWIIDTGSDFPDSARRTIDKWESSAIYREREGSTTRGWNGYTSAEHREFKYLTPKLRLGFKDLDERALGSRSFHLICNAGRLVHEVKSLRELRLQAGSNGEKPLIIWEPVPDLCVPAELPATIEALAYVDVISPNHEELASLLEGTVSNPEQTIATGTRAESDNTHSEGVNVSLVERQAQYLLNHGIGPTSQGAIVVRCGARGVYIRSQSLQRWLPAYHQSQDKVVDPTGGGNGFLGAFAVGLVRSGGDFVEAAKWGSVGAGLAIEQVGVPELRVDGEGEVWNGWGMGERLREYKRREGVREGQ